MLKSDKEKKEMQAQQRTTRKLPKPATAAGVADKYIPRTKLTDPTIPSEGTRPTYFTGLSTRSFESIKSLSRKPFLDNYMTIRVKPAKLVVLDYEPGSQHECIFTIVNYSKKVQYMSLGNTTTRLFNLAKDAQLSEFSVAPGLEKRIKVLFHAPPADSDEGVNSDALSKLYLDRLEIQVRDGQTIIVPMEAFPPASKLEFPEFIDLGTLQVNQDMAFEWDTYVKSTPRQQRSHKKENDVARKDKIKSGWIKKKITLTTLGKRPAQFSFEFDTSKPIKITPLSGTMQGDSCTYITLEYLPIFAGEIDEKIKIRLENNVPSPTERMGSKNLAHIILRGTVIDRKVHLSTPSGLDILEPEALDFGSVYYGQTMYLPVQIKNQDSKRLNWSLSHSHKNLSNVPKLLIKKAQSVSSTATDSNELAFVAVPSEGLLEPGQTQTIRIAFEPVAPIQIKKFKNQTLPLESKSYKLAMKLQTLETGQSNNHSQDEPIDILLKGVALPFLLHFSESVVTFPRKDNERTQHKTFKVINGNAELGVSFSFEKVAHFDIEPTSGNLLPLEALDISVTFKPNQYGHFQIVSKCIATPFISHVHSDQNSLVQELVLMGENHLSTLDLTLTGSWLPNILPKNISGSLKNQEDGADMEIVKPSTVEWKKKVAHRQRYIDYIRGEGALKPRTYDPIDSLKQVVAVLQYKDEEKFRPNCADQRTGLVPPEPIGRSLVSRNQTRSGGSDSIEKEQHAIQMDRLFQKLAESVVQKPRHFSEIGFSPIWSEELLSSNDLTQIYSSTSILDFGEVTVHSLSKLPLNFLNATPSRCPIHITHSLGGDSKMVDTSFISISPHTLKIGAFDFGGLEVSLHPHAPGNISVNLCYIVNKRYVYHVLVKAVIIGIDLKCSIKRLDLCLSDEDLFKKKESEKGLQENSKEKLFASREDHFDDLGLKDEHQAKKQNHTKYARISGGKEFTFPYAESTFTLTNPGNYRAYFEISDSQGLNINPENELLRSSNAEGAFFLEPECGFVEAHSSVQIRAKYIPGTKIFADRFYQVSVYDCYRDGKLLLKRIPVAVHGSTELSGCQLLWNNKQGPLDFGILPLSSKDDHQELYDVSLTSMSKNPAIKFPISGVKTVKIKNEGVFAHAFVAFAVEREHEVDISPHCGVIADDQTIDLTITILPSSTGIVEDEIIINMIGGGKSFRIPIKYDCRRPHLEFIPLGALSFSSSVILESSSIQSYSVFNKGSVFGRIVFDLTHFPEFSVATKDDRSRNTTAAIGRRGSVGVASFLRAGSAGSNPKPFKLGESRASSCASQSSVTTGSSHHRVGRANHHKHIYVVDSQPGDRFILDLIYTPKTLSSYSNIIQSFLLGTKVTYDCETNTRSIPSPLILSERDLQFEEKIIHPDGKGKSQSIKYLDMENISDKNISWNASVSGLASDTPAFVVSNKNGAISPGSKQSIEINFNPSDPGSYHATLNVGIDYMRSDTAIPVKMKGSAMKPSIHFQPQEIFFPIVPLGQTSQVVFWIWNFGCDSGDIIAEIPPEIKRPDVQFDLSFPEGRYLKENGNIPCVVKFQAKSKKPISFTIRVPFQDPEAAKYYLTIHGTSDFSDITTASHSLNAQSVLLARSSPKFYLQKRDFKTPGGTVITSPDRRAEVEGFWNNQFQSISFWLNEPFGQPVESFPNSLISSLGLPIINLIHFFAAKKSSTLAPPPSKTHSGDLKHTLRHYNELINFLTIHGALLSTVKAEFLLSAEDYRTASQNHETQKQKGSRIDHTADPSFELEENLKHFSLISKEAWCTLILQVLRIFLFPASTSSLVKSLHEDDQIDVLNVMQAHFHSHGSATDATLLSWVGSILKKETDSPLTCTSFVNGFSDGVVYRSLLIHHVPSCQKSFLLFVNQPQNDEQKLLNASLIKRALIQVFGESPWTAFNEHIIVNGTEVDHRLLILFLFQSLPYFLPKTEIEFNSQLHELQTRHIEITNSTSKPVVYITSLTGAKEFSIHESSFTVPPKACISFKIDFKSRFARQSEGVITIRTKKSFLGSANVLSFKLFAVAPTLTPIQTITAEAPIYSSPPILVKIDVQNPFHENANFKVQLQHFSSGLSKMYASKLDIKALDGALVQTPPAFSLSIDALAIDAGKTGEFQLHFMPFEFGQMDCSIVFNDPEVGEFMIAVKGKGLAPLPVENTSFIGTSGIPMEKVLRVSAANALRERAIHTFLGLNYSLGFNSASKSRSSATARDRSRLFGDRDAYQLPKQNLRYSVKYLSPFISGPSEVIIKPFNPTAADKHKTGETSEHSHSELPVTFKPETSGKYVCEILLSCLDCVDYRLIVVNALARSEGSRADLEFKVQAKRVITQDIPIINQSDEDWPIRALLSGDYFSVPFIITAKAGTTTMYPIVFRPRKRCQVIGSLVLSNSCTNQKYNYNLKGIGLEPEAEDTLQISCSCREKQELNLLIANDTNSDAIYDVITDLPISKGERTIGIPANSTKVYNVEVIPLHSGQFAKFIKFFNPNDESFSWYSVKMQVNPARPDYSLSLECVIRESRTIEILLKNPLSNQDISYQVSISGSSYLTGSKEVAVPKQGEVLYKLVYAPLIPGSYTGSVKFSNPTIGEFSNEVALQANDAKPKVLDLLQCPLGKSKSVLVQLSNPLDSEVIFDAKIGNPRHFQVFIPPIIGPELPTRSQEMTKKILLDPFQKIPAQLVYWPSSVGEVNESTLEFCNPSLGSIAFSCSGVGLDPVEMKPLVIVSPMSESKGESIEFENPFFETTQLEITLDQASKDFNVFSLLNSSKTRFVGGLETLAIQVTYKPIHMGKSHARLIIESSNQKHRWVYPIEGVPEVQGSLILLKSKVREKTDHIAEIQITSLPFIPTDKGKKVNWSHYFRMDLVGNSTIDKSLLENVLAIKVIDTTVVDSSTLTLKVLFQFLPSKLLDTRVHLSFTNLETGSLWKFPINMIATTPHIDDTIIIQGDNKKVSTVCFNLKNPYDRPLKFKTYFYGKKQPTELTVTPTEGTLAPSYAIQETDNQFFISFTPLANGKSTNAMLIVETDQFALFYEVKGITPLVRRK